jgi:sugar lactone lactonase YvrE/ribosomal protein S11
MSMLRFVALCVRPLRLSLSLLTLACLALPIAARAQVTFNGVQTTLDSKHFSYPGGVAVDGSGNVFVADEGNNAVKEILAVNGSIPASPTIDTLGSGFNITTDVAVDGSGNVFVADEGNNAVKEILAASGYYTVNTLSSDFSTPDGVAVDGSGNVFVADYGNNAVKEILAAGGYTTVNTLGSGFYQPYGVAVDGSGNVFVADTYHNAVKEILAVNGSIPASPTINTLGSGFSHPDGMAVDGSGNVYVADRDNNAVKEILAAGGYTTVNTLGSGFSYPQGVAVDGSGNVYVAETGNNFVVEVALQSVNFGSQAIGSPSAAIFLPFTVAAGTTVGSIAVLTTGIAGKDFAVVAGSTCTATTYASATNCQVNANFTPLAAGLRRGAVVFYSGAGNTGTVLATVPVYGIGTGPEVNVQPGVQSVNFGSQAIGSPSAAQTLNFSIASGTTVARIAVLTTGIAGKDFAVAAGSTCTATTYASVTNCQVNVNFTPLAAGLRRGAVAFYDGSGNALATVPVYGIGTGPQVTFQPGVQSTLSSGFYAPGGVAVDGSGNVFVADTFNSAVYEILAAGGYSTVNILANTYTSLGGFFYPRGLAVDGSGNIFVADGNNNAVKEILAAGGYTTVNTLASAYTLSGGFSYPYGVAVDGSGNVFVADYANNAVKEILAAGGYTTVNTLGSGFGYPWGVAVDGSGNVFVADFYNSGVQEILAASGYTTVNTLGSGFGQPTSVGVDGSGNVYVADPNTDAVYEILAAGGYSTVNTLGSGFFDPEGVAVDGSGNVFVADTSNNRVVELDYADAPSLGFATTFVGSTSTDSPRTVQVANIGNQPLIFTTPATGSNPSYPANFPEDTGDSNLCASGTPLAPGAACDVSVDFVPTATGSKTGSVVLKDNNLNQTNATQTILLSGKGTIAPQTISFPTITGTQYALTQLTLNATATSGLPVTFSSTTASICSVSGSTLSLLIPGTCVVHASQAGNSVYAAAPTVAQSFAVRLAPQTITFTPITGTLYALASVPLSATASSGLPVSFSSGTTSICSVSGSTLSLLIAGTCIVHASQAGNTIYAAAPTVTQSFAVHLIPQSISMHGLTQTPFALTQVNLPATATSGLAVNFTSVTPAVCTASGQTATLLFPGTCVVHAAQAGNSDYAAAPTVAEDFTVQKAQQTITFPPVTGTQYALGQVTLTATASSGLAVTYTSLTPTICTVSGATASLLIPGTCIVRAAQAGSTLYSAASLVSQSFAVAINPQTISFPPITGTQYALGLVPLSATATSGLAVTFTSTTPTVCSAAGTTASLLIAGTCILQAKQAGNSDYSAAPVVTQSFAVHLVSQTITFAAVGTQTVGANVTLTATATSGLTVTFSSTTTSVCTVSGNTLSLLTAGTCVLHAAQAGNSVYAAAPAVAQSFAVKAAK